MFAHAERILEMGRISALPSDSETCKILKAAHAINMSSVINFLPTILNQLFILLVESCNEDVGLNIIRLLVNLIHIVSEEAQRKDFIAAYVKYVFKMPPPKSKTAQSVHSELCKYLPTLLHPNNTDFLLVHKFMRYSNVFFDIIIKSMAQFLLSTGRIKMHRNERFPKEFLEKVNQKCLNIAYD